MSLSGIRPRMLNWRQTVVYSIRTLATSGNKRGWPFFDVRFHHFYVIKSRQHQPTHLSHSAAYLSPTKNPHAKSKYCQNFLHLSVISQTRTTRGSILTGLA